jgi:MIP family channel proteins
MAVPKALKFKDFSFSLKAFLAEFLAMMLFVYTGCATASFFSATSVISRTDWESGTSTGGVALSIGADNLTLDQYLAATMFAGSWGIITALSFGMGIAVLAYCTAHVSGGQLNPVVSTALFLTGNLGIVQALANIVAQYIGAILGAGILYGTTPDANAATLGANSVSHYFTSGQAVVGEAVMTCLLIFTVLQTCCERKSVAKNMAPLVIGFSVFLGHCALLPVDGCSINPTRSFGPAAVAGEWASFWVFNAGPWLGGLFGVACHLLLGLDWSLEHRVAAKGKKQGQGATNTSSNENSGVSDAALRF